MTYKNCNKTTRKQYCVIFKVISRILLPSVNHTRPVSKQEILKTSIGEDKPHQKPLPYCIKSSLSVPTLWMGTFIMPSQEAARVWLSFRAMVWGTPPGNIFPENTFHGPMAEQVREFFCYQSNQLYFGSFGHKDLCPIHNGIFRLTDLLIDDKIMITKSLIIPVVSGLYRPTGLLFIHWVGFVNVTFLIWNLTILQMW